MGKMLKERRESDDLYNIYSYAEDDTEDPALKDEELNQKLVENENLAKEKLEKVTKIFFLSPFCLSTDGSFFRHHNASFIVLIVLN